MSPREPKIVQKCFPGASRRPPKAQPTTETLCKPFFHPLGALLAALGAVLGPLGPLLRPPGALLGPILASLGPFGRLLASWGLSLAPGAPQEAPKARKINKISKSIVLYKVSAGNTACSFGLAAFLTPKAQPIRAKTLVSQLKPRILRGFRDAFL